MRRVRCRPSDDNTRQHGVFQLYGGAVHDYHRELRVLGLYGGAIFVGYWALDVSVHCMPRGRVYIEHGDDIFRRVQWLRRGFLFDDDGPGNVDMHSMLCGDILIYGGSCDVLMHRLCGRVLRGKHGTNYVRMHRMSCGVLQFHHRSGVLGRLLVLCNWVLFTFKRSSRMFQLFCWSLPRCFGKFELHQLSLAYVFSKFK